ncbi:Magnesium transport protein [Yarrowia sp. B02]|nr:Magnesium transport protein [Yarrowia sp. B02]
MTFSTHVFDSEDPDHPKLPKVFLEDTDNNESALVFDSEDDEELEEEAGPGEEGHRARFLSFGRRGSRARTPSFATAEAPPLSVAPSATSNIGPRSVVEPEEISPVSFEKDLEAQDTSDDAGIPGIMLTTPDMNTGDLQIEEPRGRGYSSSSEYRPKIGSKSPSLRRKSVHTKPSRSHEPGLNPLLSDTLQRSLGSAVTIVDYSADRYKVIHGEVHRNRDTEKFEQLLDEKPSWSKVRWINVNGLSYEAISCIAEKYNLHRLALEDMVDIPQRTKIDPYPNQIFCVVPLHKLIAFDPSRRSKRGGFRRFWDSNGLAEMKDNLKLSRTSTTQSVASNNRSQVKNRGYRPQTDPKYEFEPGSLSAEIANVQMETMYEWHTPISSAKRTAYLNSKRPLSAQKRTVGMEQVSIFLVKGAHGEEGTVISFFEHSAADVERRILARISSASTILRESCDASMLLQAILDGVVDLIIPIIITYQNKMADYESKVLQKPSLALSQNLHLLERDLCMLRSTIAPITTVVNSLRGFHANGSHVPSVNSTPTSSMVSELAKIYLADVADHSQIFTEDLDIMRAGTKNMTDLIFNTITSKSNDLLTIISFITVILQPMTVISGIFGMNFDEFPEIHNHGVSYYWYSTVPVVGGLLILIFFKSWILAFLEWIKINIIYGIRGRKRRYS